jgi:hypothetical protein
MADLSLTPDYRKTYTVTAEAPSFNRMLLNVTVLAWEEVFHFD